MTSNKINYKQIQEVLNDLAGSVVLIWAMILITVHGGSWEYVALVGMGLTAIVGKNIGSAMIGNGMGGSNLKEDLK